MIINKKVVKNDRRAIHMFTLEYAIKYNLTCTADVAST